MPATASLPGAAVTLRRCTLMTPASQCIRTKQGRRLCWMISCRCALAPRCSSAVSGAPACGIASQRVHSHVRSVPEHLLFTLRAATSACLQGDELLPPGEQSVFYDDYGERYVVDEKTRQVRKDDVQQPPLPEDMQWLNSLSDEEYHAYWDEVDAR